MVLMPSLWVTIGEGSLLPLEAEGYTNEKDFQKLLADNPAVLAAALEGEDASEWLLIDRELPIKAEESDVGTWSVDHLFVSADGTPILIEVKRSSDPRARREVVAQMLDYAASFAFDWSAERLHDRWERRSRPSGDAARQAEMDQFLAAAGLDESAQFWSQVQTRIDAGQIRLVFVADRLSPTLVRIIEYLNGQLRSAEVLGVEVIRHSSAATTGPIVYQPVVPARTQFACCSAEGARVTPNPRGVRSGGRIATWSGRGLGDQFSRRRSEGARRIRVIGDECGQPSALSQLSYKGRSRRFTGRSCLGRSRAS